MLRLIITLVSICIIASLLLAVTYNLTKDKIQAQEEKAEKEALSSVLTEADSFVKVKDYYKGLNKKKDVIGYAFIGSGNGYSSTLKIMIGVDVKYNIKGIKILSQQETPGLGARVDEAAAEGTLWDILKGRKIVKGEPWFQAQFRNKQLDEVQAITGATITSDAVVNIVKKAVERFEEHERM